MSVELEDRLIMIRQVEQRAEKSRIIDTLRFFNKRPEYRIGHRCILCNGIMYYSPYAELSYIRIIHQPCRKALTKFKKQKKFTLSQYLKIMGIEVIRK